MCWKKVKLISQLGWFPAPLLNQSKVFKLTSQSVTAARSNNLWFLSLPALSSWWPPTLWPLAASPRADPSPTPELQRPAKRQSTVRCMRAGCWPPRGTSSVRPPRWACTGARTPAVRAMGITLHTARRRRLSTHWWAPSFSSWHWLMEPRGSEILVIFYGL